MKSWKKKRVNPNLMGEEELLLKQVQEIGHAWKEIAHALNAKYANDEDLGHRFGRTPENIKDKWKQLGGENSELRQQGPWSLEEALKLLRVICAATEAPFMKKSVKVNVQYQDDEDLTSREARKKHKKRFKIIGDDD